MGATTCEQAAQPGRTGPFRGHSFPRSFPRHRPRAPDTEFAALGCADSTGRFGWRGPGSVPLDLGRRRLRHVCRGHGGHRGRGSLAPCGSRGRRDRRHHGTRTLRGADRAADVPQAVRTAGRRVGGRHGTARQFQGHRTRCLSRGRHLGRGAGSCNTENCYGQFKPKQHVFLFKDPLGGLKPWIAATDDRGLDALDLSATGGLFTLTAGALFYAGMRRRSDGEMDAKKLRRRGSPRRSAA